MASFSKTSRYFLQKLKENAMYGQKVSKTGHFGQLFPKTVFFYIFSTFYYSLYLNHSRWYNLVIHTGFPGYIHKLTFWPKWVQVKKAWFFQEIWISLFFTRSLVSEFTVYFFPLGRNLDFFEIRGPKMTRNIILFFHFKISIFGLHLITTHYILCAHG